MACTVAPPGSPVFSPSSRLPAQVSFKHPQQQQPAAPEGSSPLRLLALRAAKLRNIRPADPPLLVVPAASHAPSSSSSSSSNAKRRRPPPLLVPAAPTPLDTVAAARTTEEVAEESGEGFAAYCRRGKGRNRLEMEDRHAAALTLGGDPSAALFAVFDGHGGKSAAEFAANNMPRIIADELLLNRNNKSSSHDAVEAAVRRAYLRTDDEFSSSSAAAATGGGACCVTALLLRDRRQLVVSGAGDCRAVLARRGGSGNGNGKLSALALTSDHRASRRDERDRIEALPGGLVLRDSRGTWRVRGSLAVTRGIGDAHLKPWVLPDPETTTLDLDDGCELLVLASDGLWDKVGNQEAVDACCSGSLPPAAACRRLVDMAVARGSTDDISVLVVHLKRLLLLPRH